MMTEEKLTRLEARKLMEDILNKTGPIWYNEMNEMFFGER